jgi:hypothetical protein
VTNDDPWAWTETFSRADQPKPGICVLCTGSAGDSFCQVCKRTICAGCLTDHSHGLDGSEKL